MLVGIHQPHYLPWLRYFEKIARSDVFILLDNVQYNKNGWQNRNRVKGAAGEMLLTVPVHAPLGAPLDAVAIDNNKPWRRKHARALAQAYARAPHWPACRGALEAAYAREWTRLNDLNTHLIAALCGALGIGTPIVRASTLGVSGTGTARLAALIRAVGGDAYYSGAYALESYLDPSVLEESGIRLVLQQWSPPVYGQGPGPFLPDLSIVDLLAHTGPEAAAILRRSSA